MTSPQDSEDTDDRDSGPGLSDRIGSVLGSTGSVLGSTGRTLAYAALNSEVDGTSANDHIHEISGRSVEVSDRNGNRLSDPVTDVKKARQSRTRSFMQGALHARNTGRGNAFTFSGPTASGPRNGA
jgi:hypothetical protein